LYELATRDALTGALNRAGLQRELLQTERDFSGLLLMDLDHLKRVNDVHGHDVGDRLLQRFTEIVHAEIGERDMLVRMGGEEFLLLVVDANPKVVAERIRRAFADKSLGLGATVSIGVVNLDRQRRLDLRADLKAADEALYMAKRSGRDRVQMAELA
jgi:diguanylate cyclase (GGDEF)-like protein